MFIVFIYTLNSYIISIVNFFKLQKSIIITENILNFVK